MLMTQVCTFLKKKSLGKNLEKCLFYTSISMNIASNLGKHYGRQCFYFLLVQCKLCCKAYSFLHQRTQWKEKLVGLIVLLSY